MVRTIIKGGVWKNTEDEVLKAAIAKYGKNQWARISSLLVRKTPKQCKARWYEWLDPSIKKTEWSKEEDEKVLHLAKLMPTQWRTIAPIVGRTATQCLERYQKLLDEAEAKEHEELGLAGPSDGATGPSADDVRKLRPGEIDPDPETKPARPDPIDMDEDEKEMLSEARARLANTQGKKAKRKARERQLEEARRLAVLQKKRELKAAGIIMRSKTKRKGMDYNADIPFEKKAAPGFYDTTEEQSRIMAAPVGQTLRRLENKRKPDAEDEERRKRQKRESESKEPGHQTKFIPSREAQIQKLKEAESIGRRRKLVLPNAQVGESELEEIVKIGLGSEEAKALVSGAGGNEASGRLLSDYEGGMLEGAKMARTPSTVPHTGTGFAGTTPTPHVAFTPNPLMTPRRDNLAINPERLRVSASKRALQAGFMNLPKPENNFELVVPDEEEGADGDDVEGEGVLSVEDAAQRDARIKKRKEEEERRELARRSEVIKCGLPRPANVDVSAVFERLNMVDDGDEGNEDVDRLLNTELVQLVRHDSLVYPLPGTTLPGTSVSDYTPPDDESLAQASDEIHQELATLLGFPSASPGQVKEGLMKLSKAEADGEGGPGRADWEGSWASIRKKLVYSVKMDKWVDSSELSEAERVEGYGYVLQQKKESMAREAAKLAKVEKKLGIILGGYHRVGQSLSQKVESGFEKLRDASIELNVFKRLKAGEEAVVGHKRVTALEDEVEKLEVRERMGQMRYEELGRIREEMVERITELEERVMEFAEGVNEERLREMENGSH